MAGGKNNLGSSDFDNLELGDLDFSLEEFKDNRKPITKLATSFAAAAKEEFASRSLLRRTVTAALPSGYGKAINVIFDTGASAKKLYNTAVDELRPVLPDMQNAVKKIMPKASKILPKSITDKINAALEPKQTSAYQVKSDAERNNDEMIQSLGSIFQAQTESSASIEANKAAVGSIRARIQDDQFHASYATMRGIGAGIHRLVTYQDEITSKYQRKSLELQYRQYFATRDLLTVTTMAAKDQINLMRGVLRNTSLPETDKIKFFERESGGIKSRLVSSGQDFFSGYMAQFRKNLVDSLKNNLGGAVQAARMGLDMKDMPGMDASSFAGSVGGSVIGSTVADRVGHAVGKFVGKRLGNNEKIRKLGDKLSYYASNPAQRVHDWSKTYTSRTGVLGWLEELIKSHAPRAGQDSSLGASPITSIDEPVNFNSHARRSLTEVIPGFLSRIHQELAMIRTGSDKIDPVVYNLDRGEFTTKRTAAQDAWNRIYPKDAIDSVKNKIKPMVDVVSGGKTLSKAAQDAIAQQALRDVVQKRGFSPKSYMFDLHPSVPANVRKEISDHYREHFQLDSEGNTTKDTDHKNLADAVVAHEELRNRAPDGKQTVQAYMDAGQGELIRSLGVTKKEGVLDKYDYDKASDIYLGKSDQFKYRDMAAAPAGMMRHPVTGHIVPAPVAMPADQSVDEFKENVKAKLDELTSTASTIAEQFKAKTEPKVVENEKEIKLLEQILDVLEHRDFGYGHGAGEKGPGLKDKVGGWARSAKDWASGKATTGKDRAKGLWDRLSGVRGLVGGAWGVQSAVARSTFGMAWNGIRGIGSKLKDSAAARAAKARDAIGDLHVKGRFRMALSAAKLKAGEYFDKDGKVIKSWKDVKGAVYDKYGKVKLSAKDYAAGLVEKYRGKKPKEIFSGLKAAALASWLGKKVLGANLAPLRFAGTAGSYLKDKFKGLLDRFDHEGDVYVNGDPDPNVPRIKYVLLQQGEYYSVKSKKVIFRVKDIDGPIKDGKGSGNIVLDMKDIDKGLLDHLKRPFKLKKGSLLSVGGMLGGIGSFIAAPLKIAKSVVTGAWDLLHGGVKRLLPGLNKGGHDFGGKNTLRTLQTSVSVQRAIFHLLHERIPKPEHLRKGSWEEKFLKRSHADELATAAASGTKSGGLFGALGGLGSWLKDKMSGKKKEDPKKDDSNSVAQDASDAKDVYDDAKGIKNRFNNWRRLRQLRKLGKLGQLGEEGAKELEGLETLSKGTTLGKWGSRIGKGVKWGKNLLNGARGLGAATEVAEGVGTAAEVGTAAAGVAEAGVVGTAAAGVGIGSTILGGLGTAATIGLGIISSPVVLVGAAVAALGIGAWYAYKYMDSKKPRPLRAARLASYGLDPKDSDGMKKVLNLEDTFKDMITYGPTGASISPKGITTQKVMKAFGVDLKNVEQVRSWLQWFSSRFKPVYLTALAALNKIDPKVKLANVDEDLDVKKRLGYLNAMKADSSAFSVSANPFGSDGKLVEGAKAVEAAFAVSRKMIEADTKKDADDSKPGFFGKLGAGLMSMVKSIGKGIASFAGKAVSWVEGLFGDKKDKPKGVAGTGNTLAAAVAGASALGGIGNKVKGVSAPVGVSKVLGSKIVALQSIRYKAYGLSKMDDDKVKAVFMLEEELYNEITIGSKGVASFDDDASVYFTKFCTYFNILVNDQDGKDAWMDWFLKRFLPVLLQFASSVYRVAPNMKLDDADNSLGPSDALTVATEIIGAKSPGGGILGGSSVWSASTSPWPKYALNTNVNSCDENLDYIKSLIKAKEKAQQTAKPAKDTDKDAQAKKDADSKSWFSSIGDKVSSFFGGDKKDDKPKTVQDPATQRAGASSAPAGASEAGGASAGSSAPITGVSNAGAPDPYAAGGGKGDPAKSMGSAVGDFKTGTGGAMDKIPLPEKGAKGWAGAAATITAAANMAGVDPKVMGTFAQIESNFRSDAHAGTSSAAGYFQFTGGTWRTMLNKYGAKYGISMDTSPLDPRANALMGAEFLRENQQTLTRRLGRPVTDTELYLAHFLGAGGATGLLKAPNDANAAALFPAAASANKSIFYGPNGARSVAEVIALMNQKVTKAGGYVTGLPGSSAAKTPGGKDDPKTANTSIPANGKPGGLGTPNGMASTTPTGSAPPATNVAPTKTAATGTPTPATGAASGAKPASPAMTPLSTTAVPAIDRSAVGTGGLSSSTDDSTVVARRTQAMQQAAAADETARTSTQASNDKSSSMVSVLNAQLVVQQSMDATLKSLLMAAKANAGTSPAQAANASPASSPSMASSSNGSGGSQAAPPAPIDVSRKTG
jgi:hypothetical protein